MKLKYTKLVIERSRFAAGQYDINLANEAERELAAMQARIDTLEKLLLKCKDAVEYTAEFDKEDMQTYQEIIKALK